jgi:hypothetical protein
MRFRTCFRRWISLCYYYGSESVFPVYLLQQLPPNFFSHPRSWMDAGTKVLRNATPFLSLSFSHYSFFTCCFAIL